MLQAGEFTAARSVWENLINAYDNGESDKHWVALAREALQRTAGPEFTDPHPNNDGRLEAGLGPIVERIRLLRAAGQSKEADALKQSLEFLYRDDPEIEKLRRMLAPEKD